MYAKLLFGALRTTETVCACGWGGESDVCEGVDVVDGVVGGGAVGCVGETEEGEEAEVS